MQDRVELAPGVYVAPGGWRMRFTRSGGPGGQNVNKLNTMAQLWVRLDAIVGLDDRSIARLKTLVAGRLTTGGEIHLQSRIHRSQQANRNQLFLRLRQMILRARVEPAQRRKTSPTVASRRRRLQDKLRLSRLKSQRRAQPEW